MKRLDASAENIRTQFAFETALFNFLFQVSSCDFSNVWLISKRVFKMRQMLISTVESCFVLYCSSD